MFRGIVFGNEKVGEIAQSDIDVMFSTNILGLIALTQQFVPRFKKQGHGDILNLGSIAGIFPYPGGAIYCATKAALRSFTQSLRKELIDSRIRVMEVQPGAVETEFSIVRMRGDKAKADAIYAGTEPLTPDDVAEVIVFNCKF
jgi:3-hydroxy acid dehydrogenase/malonic semialdehyde reductase